MLQPVVQQVRVALGGLRPRWREVLTLRMAGRTLKEAGAKIGVSKERVRQIEAKALDALSKLLQ